MTKRASDDATGGQTPLSGATDEVFVFPASSGQERLWFLDQLQGGSAYYHIPAAVRFEGPLDVQALERSFQAIVARHEPLRTSFATHGKALVQVVSPRAEHELRVVDLHERPERTRNADALAAAVAAAREPFDLERGPLFRTLLLRLGERDHVLLAVLHHAISDYWSLGVLMSELAALYAANARGTPLTLPELPVQYGDYVAWQQECLKGELLDQQLSYWRNQLAGELPGLELPADRPRPSVMSFRGAHRMTTLPRALSESLQALSRQEGATLFMTMLAGFQTLLHRYSGQDDILVGAPIAGRDRTELEGLIGYFANTLVLRTSFSGSPSFREVLRRVRATTLGALAHKDMPFEKLVETLRPRRDLSRSPVFQALFIFLNIPFPDLHFPGLRMIPLAYESGVSKFDLTVEMAVTADGLGMLWEYSTDLFDDDRMARMLEHFQNLLERAVASPDRPVGQLPLLGEHERRKLLEEAGVSRRARGPALTVPELFERQAQRRPEAVAVVCEGRKLTYRELDERANQLSNALRRRGVELESRVALFLDRSEELVMAELAVLKAGAAYVPLDPSYPPDRIGYMLEDAAPSLVVTRSPLRSRLPSSTKSPLPCLHLDAEEVRSESSRAPDLGEARFGPESGAYVIYTSGSTGRPKGVAITHGSVTHLVESQRAVLSFGSNDVWTNVHSHSFDFSVWETWAPLLTGGRVVVVPTRLARAPDAFLELLADEAVTVLNQTPSALRALVAAYESHGRPPGELRLVICGGEALPADLVTPLLRWGVPLWNFYGPTEATVWASAGRVEVPPRDGATVPIGRPLANVRVILADADLELVPQGVPGEVCIGGPGLARGYFGAAGATAERFVPDPFGPDPGARLYRTGDLAVRRADGTLEFLGRIDRQVKLRGHRIELGEIEAVIREHPSVREAAAVVHDEAPGDQRLFAFVVCEPNADTATDALREFARKRLPDYMVPALFAKLEALPRTPGGKLDRSALPTAQASASRKSDSPSDPPRSLIETTLAEIWADLLHVDRIGRSDSFFELGGHSLLATQVIARARKAFEVDLPLRALFEEPTIRGLAAAVLAARARAPAANDSDTLAPKLPVITPQPEARYEPFPLTDVQQAYVVGRSRDFQIGNVGAHGYLEIEARGIDVVRLERAVRRLIERHDMLRSVVLPDGRQQVLPQVPAYRVPVADFRGCTEAEASAGLAKLRARLSHQVLDPDRWPVFELVAARLDAEGIRFFLSHDLLITDAWSIQIVIRDLARFYLDPEIELEPLSLSFRDYVLGEAALRDTDLHRRAERYWLDRLPTLPPAPELPLARDPRELDNPHFVRRSGQLPPERWQLLKERAGRAGLTPSATLIAAFSEVLAAWCREPRFTLNLTLFQRLPLHPQVNEIVGDFTSLTLLEVDESGREAFAARARRLQRQLWDDLDHRYVGGIRVLRELIRLHGSLQAALMPVVFTSTLNFDSRALAPPPVKADGEVLYGLSQTPQVWLDHQVMESYGALVFNWDAVEDLFPPRLLDDMFSAYRTLLDLLIDSEEAWQRPVSRFVSDVQLRERRVANATAVPEPAQSLHALFLAQSKKTPDAPAVIHGNVTLSYDELRRRANRVARRLRELKAQRDQLVAIVTNPGHEQVVAVLGVLLSGAAYLPLDPALPPERLRTLLGKAEVRLVLTQSEVDAGCQWPEGLTRLRVDRPADWDAVEDSDLDPAGSPNDLAYVIYTSGSTGEPKGVMIEHAAAANTVLGVNRRFGLTPSDRVFGISSLGFDLSVFDLFGAFAAGACVVLADPGGARDPARWAETVARQEITVWNSVPALMDLLVEFTAERAPSALRSLRLVLLSGDWIPVRLPDRVRALAPEAQVVSLGGATEASIWSVFYSIDAVEPAWTSIPYGRPLANQALHVLDEGLEPRPVWVPGELYIEGAGLARGYWRDPERTRERFATHPRTGSRLYRTGDWARYLPDGTLEFLGRRDLQVKVQGYRVELGEIEAALAQHPDVLSVAAVAVGAAGEKRTLAAFFVAPLTVSPETLRSFLRSRLPEYMVPSRLVRLDALPLSPNGKVDRNALARRASVAAAAPAETPAEWTPLARRIASYVEEVIGAAVPAPDSNLLSLGANSIDVIRIANALQDHLGFRPDFDALYASPTVATLALEHERARRSPPAERSNSAAGTGPVLRDPAERERFKRERQGLRRFTADAPRTPLASPPEVDLRDRFRRRRTERHFALAPIPLDALGNLLACLRQLPGDGDPKYEYASAGSLYPVQVYAHVKPGRVTGLSPGLYYHDPARHELVQVSEVLDLDPGIHDPLVNRPVFDEAAFSLFLVARMAAIAPIYGGRARDFALVESGYLSQLLMMRAPGQELGLCPVGELAFERIRPLFGIDDEDELVHSLLGGRPAPPAAARARFDPDARAARLLERVRQLSPEQARAVLDAERHARARGGDPAIAASRREGLE